jgi:hypothetical protein
MVARLSLPKLHNAEKLCIFKRKKNYQEIWDVAVDAEQLKMGFLPGAITTALAAPLTDAVS